MGYLAQDLSFFQGNNYLKVRLINVRFTIIIRLKVRITYLRFRRLDLLLDQNGFHFQQELYPVSVNITLHHHRHYHHYHHHHCHHQHYHHVLEEDIKGSCIRGITDNIGDLAS